AGRIKKAMVNDPDFPQFEVLKFAAEGEQYKSGYLFPEMYGPDWYRTQRATLGTYGAAGLMDCEPVVRGGNMLKTDGILKSEDMPEDVLWVRFWDLASTEKERAGDDPDFTVGAKVAIKMIDDVPWMYIADVRWCQAEAPARNKMIVATALADGPEVWQTAEQVAGYKDAVTTLRDILKGRSIVHGQTCSKDKVIRASALEPAFEAGHVVMRKAWWNDHAIEELGQFPSGPHDDIVDAISGGYAKAEERAKSVGKMGNGLGRGAKG
ncbi:MAG: phage terminase large subunit, partial [Bryobacteraceae bacterium]